MLRLANVDVVSMFIQIKKTPNPNTLKFLPGIDVMGAGRAAIHVSKNTTNSNDDNDDSSKLRKITVVEALFTIDGVTDVMLAQDFVAVTKDSALEWNALKTLILSAMMDCIIAGKGFVDLSAFSNDSGVQNNSDDVCKSQQVDAADQEIIDQIIELIDKRVKPAVAEDGGDIEFDRLEDGVVYLKLYGACQGCPSATVTLKNGIENMLKHYIPEIKEVREAE